MREADEPRHAFRVRDDNDTGQTNGSNDVAFKRFDNNCILAITPATGMSECKTRRNGRGWNKFRKVLSKVRARRNSANHFCLG